MTITCTVLLCLGLCLGQMIHMQTEMLPTPIIWAEPGPAVAQGKPVSIWCQGSEDADQYFLYREGVSKPLRREFPVGPHNKAKFPFPHMTYHFVGRYSCLYQRQTSLSVPSKYLDLVVTGMFKKPSLSALPSPIVTSGGSVTLQCGSWQEFDWFVLCSKRGEGHRMHLYSQRQADGWFQALFTVDHVHPNRRQTYRCYGYFASSPFVWSTSSDILELLSSGVSRKPCLSVLPGPVVAPGQSLTLQCHSDVGYKRFALYMEGAGDPPQWLGWQLQAGPSGADFALGPARPSLGGRYTCYGKHNLSSPWSAPSDPLDILLAVLQGPPPTLSVQPGPVVATGENVTLWCQSPSFFDVFLLFKEGEARFPLHLRSQHQDGEFQVDFPLHPVTLDSGGTYRCYGSLSSTPFLLSHPSSPLELVVTGAPVTITPSVQTPDSTNDHTLENLIRMGLSALVLVVLVVLVFQAWHGHGGSQGGKDQGWECCPEEDPPP